MDSFIKNQSAQALWEQYVSKNPKAQEQLPYRVICFYDTEAAANQSISLVGQGIKRAYSQALLQLQLDEETLPRVDGYSILTDWSGKAHYVVQTTSMKFLPLFSVHEEHARLEGEGDKSLGYWRKTHWQVWARQLAKHGRIPKLPMMVVFERFEKLYPA